MSCHCLVRAQHACCQLLMQQARCQLVSKQRQAASLRCQQFMQLLMLNKPLLCREQCCRPDGKGTWICLTTRSTGTSTITSCFTILSTGICA